MQSLLRAYRVSDSLGTTLELRFQLALCEGDRRILISEIPLTRALRELDATLCVPEDPEPLLPCANVDLIPVVTYHGDMNRVDDSEKKELLDAVSAGPVDAILVLVLRDGKIYASHTSMTPDTRRIMLKSALVDVPE